MSRRRPAQRVLSLICLSLLVLVPVHLVARDTLPGPVPAKVLRVIDGDSIVVRASIWLGQEVETAVRLLGVDSPELRGACREERNLAARSRDFTAELAGAGTEIKLSEIQLGIFAGRVLARVESADGVDIGQALIDAGLARAYDGGRRVSWCPEAAARRRQFAANSPYSIL